MRDNRLDWIVDTTISIMFEYETLDKASATNPTFVVNLIVKSHTFGEPKLLKRGGDLLFQKML